MRAKLTYTCDECSEDGNDQNGRIILEPESGGKITATWKCESGMGRGAELLENTTELDDESVDELVNSADICVGIGEFDIEIGEDKHGWPTVTVVE